MRKVDTGGWADVLKLEDMVKFTKPEDKSYTHFMESLK